MNDKSKNYNDATPLSDRELDVLATDFIRTAVVEDITSGRFDRRVHTRFPPEPNGYLHIGHAKALAISAGIARDFGGKFNLRFDDTNPVKEEEEYVDGIIADVRWLEHDFGDEIFYASDYFEQTYQWAEQLIEQGQAYVDDLSPDEIREHRGTLTSPGTDSPYRNRSVEENLDLFRRMRAGEFPRAARVLRAKIDMASPNINLRDPIMYRILHQTHHRQGDAWCIYPMYDWAHGLGDSIEGITHSLCDLGYRDHRPLYNWFLEQLGIYHPRQIEFARLFMTYTVLSKRKLLQLVQGGCVRGWDDPRMPTIAGMRRRGYSADSINDFCARIGISTANSVVDVALLEHAVRHDLNRHSPRAMAVLDPIKIVIDNYPEGKVEWMEIDNHPQHPEMGTHRIPFCREIFIERSDFMENPPRKYYRLAPEREVRLKSAYLVTYKGVVKDRDDNVVEIHCTYDPESRGGQAPDGRRVRGTIQWVSAMHAVNAELRLYDRLFSRENPENVEENETFLDSLNPSSLEVLTSCKVEPSLAETKPGDRYQFMRTGYFCTDPDTTEGHLVFNRTIALRDTWAKIQKKQ
ncbi:MAG: glutamine--tRNA ligase/YqeY domain fusion protein [Anaerolineae bacterium]|nr:glutamine--tRNA ligase/YqeY domain fusion protein [Anaerolineae bacterium]